MMRDLHTLYLHVRDEQANTVGEQLKRMQSVSSKLKWTQSGNSS